MRKKLFLIISIFFIASLIIGQSSNLTLDVLYKDIFTDNYEVLENGVKLQYYTKTNLEEEKNRIINILSINNYNQKISKNSIYVNGDRNNIKFEIKGSLNHKGNFIEIQAIENNNKINIMNLQKKLSKIKDKYIEDEQYFTFTKGKLIKNSDEKSRLNKLFKEKKAKENETISISSGITSRVKLKNELQINYSLCDYNSGTYLIVGTPIIFIEY